jgi:DNA-binding MarR family transcriptional regulator
MASPKESLEELFVDENEVDRGVLRDLLSGYVQIGDESGRLFLQGDFYSLKSKQKVVIVLLAQLAKEEVGMEDSPRLSPKLISESGDIKKGTVDPAVRELKSEGIIEGENGEYFISRRKLQRVASYLRKNDS